MLTSQAKKRFLLYLTNIFSITNIFYWTDIINLQTTLIFFQLRVRDLEGAVEVEKSAVDEAKRNLDTLTRQHRFVMRSYRSATLLSCISYL